MLIENGALLFAIFVFDVSSVITVSFFGETETIILLSSSIPNHLENLLYVKFRLKFLS